MRNRMQNGTAAATIVTKQIECFIIGVCTAGKNGQRRNCKRDVTVSLYRLLSWVILILQYLYISFIVSAEGGFLAGSYILIDVIAIRLASYYSRIGLRLLCQHTFKHNRVAKAFSIISA